MMKRNVVDLMVAMTLILCPGLLDIIMSLLALDPREYIEALVRHA